MGFIEELGLCFGGLGFWIQGSWFELWKSVGHAPGSKRRSSDRLLRQWFALSAEYGLGLAAASNGR